MRQSVFRRATSIPRARRTRQDDGLHRRLFSCHDGWKTKLGCNPLIVVPRGPMSRLVCGESCGSRLPSLESQRLMNGAMHHPEGIALNHAERHPLELRGRLQRGHPRPTEVTVGLAAARSLRDHSQKLQITTSRYPRRSFRGRLEGYSGPTVCRRRRSESTRFAAFGSGHPRASATRRTISCLPAGSTRRLGAE